MVWQANVLLNHNRRLNILSKFLKDPKVTGEILRQNDDTPSKHKTQLFGFVLYRVLHRRDKGQKYSNEIRRELGPRHTSTYRGKSISFRCGFKKPYQKDPSSFHESQSSVRGAQTSRGRTRGRGNQFKAQRGRRYIVIKNHHVKNTNPSRNPTNTSADITPVTQQNTSITTLPGFSSFSRRSHNRGRLQVFVDN